MATRGTKVNHCGDHRPVLGLQSGKTMAAPRILLAACLGWVALSTPSTAHADYSPGDVPEGDSATTLRRHEVRVAVLGASGVGITDHTELTTYLLADAVLFPNLRLEHQFLTRPRFSASLAVSMGAGVLPLAVGTVIPLPGAVVAGGGVGVVWGAEQTATLNASLRVTPTATLSANGGGYVLEGGVAGVVGGGGAGGNGGAGGGAPVSAGDHRVGATAGLEFARTFGTRDALVVACDAWVMRTAATAILYPRITFTHAWKHFHLTGGAYALLDPPAFKATRNSKLPVGPYLNAAWTWN